MDLPQSTWEFAHFPAQDHRRFSCHFTISQISGLLCLPDLVSATLWYSIKVQRSRLNVPWSRFFAYGPSTFLRGQQLFTGRFKENKTWAWKYRNHEWHRLRDGFMRPLKTFNLSSTILFYSLVSSKILYIRILVLIYSHSYLTMIFSYFFSH